MKIKIKCPARTSSCVKSCAFGELECKKGILRFEVPMDAIVKIIQSKDGPCNYCDPHNEVFGNKGCAHCNRFNNYNPKGNNENI